MCVKMEKLEQSLLLSLEEHLIKIEIPFQRYYHTKSKICFFEMEQPLDDVQTVRLMIGVHQNQTRKIELRCFFSFRVWSYFDKLEDVHRFLNRLNASSRMGKYGIDEKGYLFSGYTYYANSCDFSPTVLMMCLLDLFEEGEKIYQEDCMRNSTSV